VKFEDIGTIAGQALCKEPDALSDGEKVAVAVMAGCAYRIDYDAQRIDIVNPIGFIKVNGKLEVRESIARRGAEVCL
jgi:hypothetical protein